MTIYTPKANLLKLLLSITVLLISVNSFAQTPTISAHPSHDTVCSGNTGGFKITATGATSYQWQESINNGSTWSNLNNTGVYSGATTDSLTLTSVPVSMHGYQYRCRATNSGTATSNSATLRVAGVVSVTNDTVCAGQTGQLTANISNIATANWFTSSSGGTSVNSGNTYSITNASATATYYVETSGPGGGTSSDTLITPYNNNNGQRGAMFDVLTGSSPITVTGFSCNIYAGSTADYEIYYRPGTHVGHENNSSSWTPLDTTTNLTSLGNNVPTPMGFTISVTIPANSRYSFYITNTFGGGLSYTDGTAVGNYLAGNSDVTVYEGVGKSYPYGLTFTVRNINMHMFYTKGGACVSSARTPATLTVNPNANVTTNPTNSSISTGANTSFSITASNASTYQWQVSSNSGSTWSNVANTGIYSGATTNTLTLTNTTTGYDAFQYRCIATNSGNCNDTSTAATLSVTGTTTSVTTHPFNVTVCEAAPVTFSITAAGTSLTYQWQQSSNGGSSWFNLANNVLRSGVNTNTLTLNSALSTYNGYLYRCVVTGSVGNATSNTATLTVNLKADITTNPSNSTISTGANTSFSITASNTSAYQWQLSTNSGSSWSNISNGGVYSNATTSTLNLASVPLSYNGYQYRCVAIGSGGCNDTSTTATLLVSGTAPSISAQPANSTICSGSNTSFNITATGTSLTYQWQVSTNSGSTWSNVSNTGIYSGATTNTLTLTSATTSVDGNQYRCVVTGSVSPAATSNAATLTINTAPAITAQPSNSTIGAGSNTSFSITATGTGITYQWQVSTNSGSTWGNLSNTGIYTGATTNTLTLTNASAAYDTYQYRCRVTGTCTPVATSNAATLTVNSAPAITAQPTNSTICDGANTSFSITATNATAYQWQVSTNSGSTWSNLSNTGIYSGATTNTLTLTAATTAVDGYQYRCEVTGATTPNAISNAATLTINSAPAITTHPTNSTICETNNTTFSVAATGAGLAYQWQVSTNSGSTWANLSNGGVYSNVTGASLAITSATAAMNTYQYRCVVSGTCTPNATSNAATLNINTAPAVTAQPSGSTICSGNNTSFSITATGTGITYQWQEYNGSTWSNLSNTGIYSGATTNTLSLTAATTAVDGYQYRCVVSGTCTPDATSNAATLTINAAPAITLQPANTTTCDGSNAQFTVTATGAGLTYQWEEYNGSTWSNLSNAGIYSGTTTNTLTLTGATTSLNNYQYRCTVNGTCPAPATSTAATLSINSTLNISTHPSNSTICSGNDTYFAVTATASGLTYQWQLSTNGGSTWSNVSNTGIYSGATADTLRLTSVPVTNNTYQYRCVLNSICASATNSNAATLSITPSPSITGQPTNSTTCSGDNTTFSITASGSGLTYQWEVYNGSTWSNVTNTGIYTGATTNTLTLTGATTTVNTYQYRCIVGGTCNPGATSNAATLTINTAPAITTQPANTTTCDGSNAQFTVAATGTGPTYQWQEYNGSTWNNLSNTGIYSGATTNTLTLTGVGSSNNSYQYRCVVSGTCTPSATSNAATLNINSTLNITVHPANSTICSGNNTSFTVTASASGLTYQWQEYNGSTWSNLSNTGIYSGVTTATLTLTGATTAANGYQYRCVLSSTCTSTANTNVATLTVNTAPAITTQPVASTICEGDNTSFSIAATGAGITYQWQVHNGTSWSNVTNTGIYAGAASNTLLLTGATAAVNGYSYRCVIGGTCVPGVNSDSVLLTVNTAPAITVQPMATTICSGNNTSFSITATGTALTYQWQVYNGTTWSNVTNTGIYSGANTNTLALTAPATAINGYQYRCQVSGTCTPAITSNAAAITVNASPAITTQPTNSTICENTNTSFSVAASGTGLTYQWEVYNGSSWSNVSNTGIYSGATSNTLTLTTATTAVDGYQYRCIIGGTCTPGATSNTATLTINTAPVVTTHPTDSTTCEGNNASFTVAATGTALTYQWQVYNGSSWSNLSNTGIYSNTTTNALSLTGITSAIDGYRYRCIVSGTCAPPDTSDPGSINIYTAPVVTTQPNNSNICEGTNTSFTVASSGTGLTYQWQVYNGSTWSNIINTGIYSGATTTTLSLTAATTAVDGYQYRCQVGGTCTPGATSNAATVTIQTAPVITAHPADSTICEQTNTIFSVAATGTGLNYQWQVYNGSTWSNVTNTGIYSGANTATLALTAATTAEDGYQYRCQVSGTCTPGTTSNPATLHINNAPAVTTQPGNSTICSGNNTSFSVAATGTNISYQWQVYNGTSWSNIANTGIYSGTTTNTLDLAGATTVVHNYQYRCVVSGTCSPAATSNAATLTINTAPAITTEPVNRVACENTNTTFEVTATGTALTYQWQVYDGSSWSNVANTGFYSGATTATLALTAVTTALDNYQYRCIIGGTCAPADTTRIANMTIQTAPVVTAQPDNDTTCEGSNASFSISATGTNISYQWQVYNGTSWSNVTNSGIYSGANTNTLSLTAATTAVHNYQYRCHVTGTCAPAATSNAVSLTIFTLPAITTQPTPSVICVGNNTTYSVAATGTGLTYQWQVNFGGGWYNLSASGIYSGINSSTLSLSAVPLSEQNARYRCIVSGTCTPPAISNDASLTINTPPVITVHPDNDTVCQAGTAWFLASANGTAVTYQWQVNTGSGWSNVTNTGNYSGANANLLTITNANPALDGYQFRCVIAGTCPPNKITNVGALKVNTYPQITQQPQPNATVCSGDNINFSIAATGSGLTYEWLVHNGNGYTALSNGGPYSGVNTPTLQITGITASPNAGTYTYVCLVKGTCANATSNPVYLNVNALPDVTRQPNNVIVCDSTTNIDIITLATGTGISYQWQVYNGTSWSNISNNATYNNAGTRMLRIHQALISMNGYKYRCIVSGTCSPADTTNASNLTVNPLKRPSVTLTASNSDICDGESVTFTTTNVNGGNATYQWVVDGNIVGANGSTYTTSTLKDMDIVKCLMTSGIACPSPKAVYSNAIQIKVTQNVKPEITITSDVGSSWCTGKENVFRSAANNEGAAPTYNWSINGNPAGQSADTLWVPFLNDGDVIECELVSDHKCPVPKTANSNQITMDIFQTTLASILIMPDPDSVICSGKEATLHSAFHNGGTNPRWQWMLNGKDIPGETQGSLKTRALKDGDTINCRFISSARCVFPEISNPITFDVNPMLEPEVEVSVVYVGDNKHRFTALPTLGGTAPYFQWYVNNRMVKDEHGATIILEGLEKWEKVWVEMASSEECLEQDMRLVNSKIITTGIAEQQQNFRTLHLYPNPNTGTFTIEGNLNTTSIEEATLTILNNLGQVVYTEAVQLSSGKIKYEVHADKQLAQGGYLLRLEYDDQQIYRRFVIGSR